MGILTMGAGESRGRGTGGQLVQPRAQQEAGRGKGRGVTQDSEGVTGQPAGVRYEGAQKIQGEKKQGVGAKLSRSVIFLFDKARYCTDKGHFRCK